MAPKGPSIPNSPAGPSSRPFISSLPSQDREQPITLRPAPGHPTSHKTFLRIHLHRSTLANLDLKPGELCHLSVPTARIPIVDDVTIVQELYPGIAWLTTDGQMGGGKAQVSEGWRALSGVVLETKGLLLGRYVGETGDAVEVVISEREDPTTEATAGWRREGDGWRYMLENALSEARYVFEGMPFISLEYKGIKRDFQVDKVVSTGTQRTASNSPHRRIISAYKTNPTTAVVLTSPGESSENPIRSTPSQTSKSKPSRPPSQSPLAANCPPIPSQPLPTFTQIGGLAAQLSKLSMLVLSTLHHSHHFTALNLTPFRGILLYGPPGTGKSLIMRCLPGTLSTHLPRPLSSYSISGSVVGKYLGESEASIRKIFKEAKENQPSIIFIDEIDSIAPKRGAMGGGGEPSDGRMITTLMTELDELGDGGTLVVAATNRPNGVDEGLRRPGRLDREIEIPRPDIKAREEILSLMLSKVRKGWLHPPEEEKKATEGDQDYETINGTEKKAAEGDQDYETINGTEKKAAEGDQDYETINGTESTTAKEAETALVPSKSDPVIKSFAFRTHGFVGADLEALVRGSVLLALSRLTIPMSTSPVTQPEPPLILLESDLDIAMKDVRPTAMREIFLETPNVRWSDIGGQAELKQSLREAVEWPLTHPEAYTRLGGTPRKGLLLYGPPGCSKTLTAKALATEAGLNFMPVKGPELLNMYVGESERAVREVFRKARAASPSIIFFDEIDALGSSRKGSSGSGGNGVNVLTALLNEMDGIEALRGVIVLAATNRPELLDPALMRPGRLDTILYVGPPDLPARREILKIKTRKMTTSSDVDLEKLAVETEGYSGAELVHICDEATHYAMREDLEIEAVAWRHFVMAKEKAVRQITKEMTRFYEEWSVGGVRKI